MVKMCRVLGRALAGMSLLAVTALPSLAQQQCPAMGKGPLPLHYQGQPTVPAITACDLMTRLYIFADDSMRGRKAATPDDVRATDYLVSELHRLGVRPAGEVGSYYQSLPVVTRALDTTSTLMVNGSVLRAGTDFLVSTTLLHPTEFSGSRLVYGGALLDTTVMLSPAVTDGRLVVFGPIVDAANSGAIQRTAKGTEWVRWYNTLHRVTIATNEQLSAAQLRTALNPTATILLVEAGAPVNFTLTPHAVEALLGRPLETLAPGTVGKPFSASLRFIDTPRPTHNVIGLIPGSEARLRGEYVVLGAHSDHAGVARGAVDHDSLRIVNLVSRPEGVMSRRQTTEDEEYEQIARMTDSVRKLRPGRPDSIMNGADVGGSGAVSLLEIAEALAKGNAKPKRSILLVWHVGSEVTTPWGSTWFTAHSTVPLDSIVAELTVEAVGRGEASDVTGITAGETPTHGNPNYLELIGSRRLSSELGNLVEAVNLSGKLGMAFDYSSDADGHPDRLYCRGDQWAYARAGIPAMLFTTGNNADTREPTDEPEYIQYRHLARVDALVLAAALRIANLDHRLVVDHPRPNASAPCQQ